MRTLLFACAALSGLAMATPAVAATPASSAATITIVIPPFPASETAAALKKAFKHMPNFNFEITKNETETAKVPPGALKFSPLEANHSTSAQIGKVASLYPAELTDGRKAHLILVTIRSRTIRTGHTSTTYSHPRQRLISVVQPDSKAFKLHVGERIVLVSSTRGWNRVLPYNGPEISPEH